MEQRFTLASLPLHRELQAPVTIGTQFSVRATPIEHDKRIVSFTLVTGSSEAALEITLHLPDKNGRGSMLRAVSRTATSESSALEKEVSSIANSKEFILGVIVKEHVFEIYLDTIFLLPFVHRVNPSEIRKIVLDGAMICNEVVVVPVKIDMPRLPAYNEVSLSARPPPPQQQPVQPLQPMSVQPLQPIPMPAPPARLPAQEQLQPIPMPALPPRQQPVQTLQQPQPQRPPVGGVAVLPQYPAGTLPMAAAQQGPPGSISKPPEPGWAAPRPPPPSAAVAPVVMPVPAPRHSPPAVAPQRAPIGAGAAPAGALVPTTSAGPMAPVVAPMPYGAAPLPRQGYPHNPPGTAPQFQNIQPIPGLSYAAQQQQHQQYPQQMQQPHQYPQQHGPYPGYYGTPYGTQYVSYPAYPTVYMNDHCHYNYWHHHHHC